MDIANFQSMLDEETAWRKKEITVARGLATQPENSKEQEKYLYRFWVANLYAHCDSFLKKTSKYYLQFTIETQHKGYKPELILHTKYDKKYFLEADDTNYNGYRNKLTNNPYELLDERFIEKLFLGSFQYNFLRFICDYCIQIQFDYRDKKDFCKMLREKRDLIVHGEESYIENKNECLIWHNKTIEFINTFKEALIENADKQ